MCSLSLITGIRVIPEFDTPGHVREGYNSLVPPILTTCYDDGKPIIGDGATGPLDVTLDATYDFLTALYDELQTIFPDKFVHVGGDEVPSACWASNPGVQHYMKVCFFFLNKWFGIIIFYFFFFFENNHLLYSEFASPSLNPRTPPPSLQANNLTSFADLETLFEQRLLDMLKKKGISYIVWQEIFDNGATIAADTVIDVYVLYLLLFSSSLVLFFSFSLFFFFSFSLLVIFFSFSFPFHLTILFFFFLFFYF